MPTIPEQSTRKRDSNRPRTVTLADIAEIAGVTAMTVSRVIKGKSDVSEATREKVMGIARELNYTANLSARALKTGRTGVIAVISGRLNQPYSANMVNLVEDLLHKSGYQMKLLHSRGEMSGLLTSANASAVDGIIVVGNHGLVRELRAAQSGFRQPCVFAGIDYYDDVDCVHSDLSFAVEEALRRMIDAGRKRIVLAGVGPRGAVFGDSYNDIRTSTYLKLIKGAGLNPEFFSGAENYDTPMSERIGSIKDQIEEKGCPDAFYCFNDDVAMHIYRAIMDLGLKIPDEVCIVGCDGLHVMEFFEPPISTVAQPMEEICAHTWQFLQNRIADPDLPPQIISLRAELLLRRSLPLG